MFKLLEICWDGKLGRSVYWFIDKWQDEGKTKEGNLMHIVLLKLQAGHMVLNLAKFCGCTSHYPSTVAQKTAPMFAYYIKTHVLLNADII